MVLWFFSTIPVHDSLQAHRKIGFTFHFWHKSFVLDDMKIAALDERIWHFYDEIKTHSDPSYIFSGDQEPNPAGSMPQQLNNTLKVESGIGHSGMPYPFVCLYVQNHWSYGVIEFSANQKQLGVVFVNSGQEVKDQGRKRELRSDSAGQMLRQSCPSVRLWQWVNLRASVTVRCPYPARPQYNNQPSWRRHWSQPRWSRRDVRRRWNAALIVVDSVGHCCRQVDQTLHQWRIHVLATTTVRLRLDGHFAYERSSGS